MWPFTRKPTKTADRPAPEAVLPRQVERLSRYRERSKTRRSDVVRKFLESMDETSRDLSERRNGHAD